MVVEGNWDPSVVEELGYEEASRFYGGDVSAD